MAQPAIEPAWHPDPYDKAELRWHDGTSWTEHVHGAPTAAAEPPPLPHVTGAEAPPAVPAWNGTAKTSPKALAALITALVGVPVVSIVLGVLARRDIAASGGRLTGNGLAVAGIVLGVLNILAIALMVAVIVPWIAARDTPPEPNIGLTTAMNPSAQPAPIDPATGLPLDPATGQPADLPTDAAG